MFLDFDGTMVDIAPQPEAVRVPQQLIDSMAWLHEYLGGAVAVISGRTIAQIDAFLHPLRLPVAGVHGAERRDAVGALSRMAAQPLDKVDATVAALVRAHPALRLEHKGSSIALHYRQAPELEELCLHAMQEAVEASPGLTLLRGKMVVEAKPGGASKGRAIEDFLRESPFAGRVPLFIGDDITDEAGFSAVQRLGGLGIKVGEGPTVAWQRLPDPAALRQELQAAMAARTTTRTPAP
ncbi:MAG: trehalose-phosphatase [Pseudomonadota bacterium]